MGQNQTPATLATLIGGRLRAWAGSGIGRGAFWTVGVLALFTACTTEQAPWSGAEPGGKVASAQLEPGRIVITARQETAAISYDPPNNRMEYAGEGAGSAARSVLDTPNLGHSQLEAAVGVLETAAAPFAAAYGAIRSRRQRLPPDKLAEAEHDLARTMRSNAVSKVLRDLVADAARQRTSRLVVCAESGSAAPASRVPVSATLEVGVEQLRLRVLKPGKSEYVLCIEARARLVRSSNGAVLLEQAYHYESGPSLFIDWARHTGLDGVVQTGYQILAEQIAKDVFQPGSEPPLLIGPGQKHSKSSHPRFAARHSTAFHFKPERLDRSLPHRLNAGTSHGRLKLVLCRAATAESQQPSTSGQIGGGDNGQSEPPAGSPSTNQPSARVTSLGSQNVVPIEIYSRRADDRLRILSPATGAPSSTGTETETQWAMDSLLEDRNAMVQFLSCLAAVPMGLWEQTVGAARKPGREKADKMVHALNAVREQRRFADGLADEVARRLRSQALNPVRRRQETPSFALTGSEETVTPMPAQTDPATNSQLALEIQVLNTGLVGKRASSRSRALCVEIQARIIRTLDGQELYCRPVLYRGSTKSLKAWAASDAKLFREELEACSQQTAQALADELVGRGWVTRGSLPGSR